MLQPSSLTLLLQILLLSSRSMMFSYMLQLHNPSSLNKRKLKQNKILLKQQSLGVYHNMFDMRQISVKHEVESFEVESFVLVSSQTTYFQTLFVCQKYKKYLRSILISLLQVLTILLSNISSLCLPTTPVIQVFSLWLIHVFYYNTSLDTSKSQFIQAIYDTPKAFRPIFILNMFSKLIEKMIAR